MFHEEQLRTLSLSSSEKKALITPSWCPGTGHKEMVQSYTKGSLELALGS